MADWDYKQAKWDAPLRWVKDEDLLGLNGPPAPGRKRREFVGISFWPHDVRHLRSNVNEWRGACGADQSGGAALYPRRVGWYRFDELTCPDCQSILASHLLAEEPFDGVNL